MAQTLVSCGRLGLLALLLLVAPMAARVVAQDVGMSTGLPLPRFVNLASDEINVRSGPGKQYPIRWVFVRIGLPVRIIGESEHWRQIEDHEGQSGWIHASLLASGRSIMIKDEMRLMRRYASSDSQVILRAEPGVLGELIDCDGAWCLVEIAERRGWMRKDGLWGVGQTTG